jgi:D-alanine-D-alanine ligase
LNTEILKDFRIGFSFNSFNGERKEDFAEYDEIPTINAIKTSLESFGFDVIPIEADLDAFEKFRKERPDLVFNIAEGIGRGARESQIPMMLEMLGIPFTGSDSTTLSIALDKARTKEILSYYRIPTPRFRVFRDVKDTSKVSSISGLPRLKYPIFLKPLREGSSIGISVRSLVSNENELKKEVKEIIDRYKQPVLAEEYVDGREFTVALIGNKPEVLPLIELDFSLLPDNTPKFDCYEVKWYLDDDKIRCPANIDANLAKKINKIAVKTFKVLDCRDLCRIDIRLDDNGVPNVLDVNPLPGLTPDPKENSRFPKACYTAGMSYREIIGRILFSAIERYNIKVRV